MEIVKTFQHFRTLYKGFEHWLIIFDRRSDDAIKRMQNRYYKDAAADDFSVFVLPAPFPLAIAAARKSMMLGRDLRRHLQRYVDPQYLPETWERDVLVMTADPMTEAIAEALIAEILEYADLSGPAEQQEAA